MSNIPETNFNFPTPEIKKKYKEAIDNLFLKAQQTDEREFIIANLYFRGILYFNNQYDVRNELDTTINDVFSVFMSEQKNLTTEAFIRFFILLYCHILESYPFYVFIYGLLDIQSGESFDSQIFEHMNTNINFTQLLKNIAGITSSSKVANNDKIKQIIALCSSIEKEEPSNWEKLNRILKKSKEVDSEIGEIISGFFDPDLRNAFSHSEYTITPKGVMIIRKHKIYPLQEVLEKVINCFHFYQSLALKGEKIMEPLVTPVKKEFNGKYGSLSLEPKFEGKGVSFGIHSTSTGKTF